MRLIGLWISLLLLIPVFPTVKQSPVGKRSKEKSLVFQPTKNLPPPLRSKQKLNSAPVDTNELKKSGWFTSVCQSIEETEYEIKPGSQIGMYSSPNRNQNLRAFYSPTTFVLQPRKDSIDTWKLELTTKGIYADDQIVYQPDDHSQIDQHGNKLQYHYQNNFITEYINSKEGIRQNFIIEKEPFINTKKITVKIAANEGWLINQVHSKEIHFAKQEGPRLDKKLTYNQLKAWDANKKELAASFAVNENVISIEVNTTNAAFPITIDPLSTTAAVILQSNQANAIMGRQVSSAGDVNGDGYSDVIVGAFQYDNGQIDEGAAFVYHGSATGISTTAAIMLEANQAGAAFGSGVAGAGDVNNDGYSDLIVGAYLFDNGQIDEGAAFIYYGSATGITAIAGAVVESNQANAQMGFFTDGAGDVNNDGYSDIIVGAHLYDNGQIDEGAAFIYHGSAAGIVTTPAVLLESNRANTFFGREVAGAGDVNGDGFSDVIVGAYGYDNLQIDEGAAYIFHGSATGINPTPALIIESNQNAANFGISVASAGDVNGDGYSDVIVGAYMYDNTIIDEGAAFIYHGSATGVNPIPVKSLFGNQLNSRFGAAVACAGDVNGDGYSDVIIGAYFYDNGQVDEGAAFLYYGSSTGIPTTPASILESNQINAVFGIALASAGDINGDGYSDIIIGAFNYSNGQTNEGAAMIYNGSPESLSTTPLIINNITQDRASFGITIAGTGDVNGDGYGDVIIGAPLYDGTAFDEGRAFVYYGTANGLPTTASLILSEANQASANFAFSVSGAGDVNGDGYNDVVVGSLQYNGIGRVYIYFGGGSGLSAISNQQLNDNQGGEGFGVSVAGAGDVNKDGYSDVIVGAYSYDVSGRTDEGRAYVYHGSPSGLNTIPASILNDAGQAAAGFGRFVASAGDINGDGFSDVLVGSTSYDDGASIDEGAVFVHYGSCSGVSSIADRILKDANESSATFGFVSGAGDLNGDGYSDIVVGAIRANGNKGRGFVYYGSSIGLSLLPIVLDNNFPDSNPLDWMGYSVSSAGDVNGDGYSDLLIGIPQWEAAGNNEQGRVLLYYGRSTGINTIPDRILADNPNSLQFFGNCVAGVGDVNGDGFSDVIVGGDHGSWPGFGIAYIYYGNDKTGLRNNLRLYNSNLSTPMNQSNINDLSWFGAGLYAKSFIGKQKGKLVWQTIKNGNTFSGNPITNSVLSTASQATYSNLGLNGVELKSLITKTVAPGVTYIRSRVQYDPVTSITGQVFGPWRYPAGFLNGNREIAEEAMTALKFKLGNDTTVCFTTPYVINATTGGATSYNWQDGSTNSTYTAVSPGLYWVDVAFGSCIFRDTIVVSGTTPTTATLNPKICQGQSYTFPSGITRNSTGTYNDTLRTKSGCDSLIYTINLVEEKVAIQNNTVTICSGQNYTLPWGNIVNLAGVYRDTLHYISGCDSIIRNINLVVQSPSTLTLNPVICSGNSYVLPSGTSVTSSGIYKDTLKYSSGCDSLYRTINLIVQSATTNTSTITLCAGQSYTLPWGTIVNTTGAYKDTLRYSITNCDSLYRVFQIVVQTPSTQIFNQKICVGQTYTLPWGTIVNSTGIYKDTLRYKTGCDSLYRIVNLLVQTAATATSNVTICSGQTYTLPWGTIVNVSGIYRDTLKYLVTNCDSLYRIVNLKVQTATTQILNPSICTGQSYILPWGVSVNSSGTYKDTLHYTTGCDSLYRIVQLTVQSIQTIKLNDTVCAGQSYLLPWGNIVNTTGIYRDTMRNQFGCDSVYRIINLIVQLPPTTVNINPIICFGQNYVLPWGVTVNVQGTYRDTLHYLSGCDSVYRIVKLTVQNPISISLSPIICSNQSYTLPSGITVNTSGIYKDTLHYQTGCDSVYRTISLTVKPTFSTIIDQTICSGQTYLLPWGITVNTSGTYKDTVRYASGCDSLYRTVHLIVQSVQILPVIKAVICAGNSYTLPWGAVVTTSGVYRDTLRYKNTGCDSIRRAVDLTVQTTSIFSITKNICQGQSYQLPWGAVVNQTGTYKDTLHFTTGCDSLYRIVQLTVTPAKLLSQNAAICAGDSYLLPWGQVVKTAGIYKDTLRTNAGCDSLITTLTLKVNAKPTIRISKSNDVNCIIGTAKLLASGGINYEWTPIHSLSDPFTSSPIAFPSITTSYKVIVKSINGCIAEDSIRVVVNNADAANAFPVPNAFTPNGDGLNDCFGVSSWGAVSSFEFSIYNRWGQRVFYTKDPYQCWDGRYKGIEQNPDLFIYQIKAKTICGDVFRSGNVQLIR